MTLKLTFGTVTDRGLNQKRAANEDRLLALADRGLFLVADGVGGRRGGQVASQTVVDVFTEVFTARPRGELLATLKQTIARCNQSIHEASTEVAELEGMATTVALVAVDGARAIIGHVGDSRVYRCDGQQLVCETADHSEVAEAVRTGTLSAAQAAHHPRRNIINRALGAEAEVEADFKIVTLDARTSFLLCSDGITRHVSDTELETLLKSGAHPQSICAQLKELCFARGAEDNLTAIVVDFGERAYVEEPTRPAAAITAPSSSPSSSRIQVDFGPGADTVTNQAAPARKREPRLVKSASSSKKSSLLSGLIQLVVLLVLIAAAFAGGFYYDQIKAWVTGRPLISGASSAPGNGSAPVNPEFAAARALFEERRYEKARDRFAEFARREPGNAEYRYWLGRAQFEAKQYQEAIKNLNEAARLDDKLPNVFVHLALAYDAAGDRKNATESLRRAIAQPAP
jgi:serine/threonine protein phosphatase PrpC/TolA-binding protein